MSNEEQIVQKALDILGEHFDAVLILVSWNHDGLTSCIPSGSGNWYARQGMAHEFINTDTAQEHARMLQQVINPPQSDDSGDDWKL